MFATVLLIYLIGTASLTASPSLIVAAIIVDFIAWGCLSNMFEAWATGTTSDQEFWKDDDK